MKRIISIILIAAWMLTLGAASALAENFVYIRSDVNVRSGPGTGYSMIAQVNSGSTLTYLQQSAYDSQGVQWFKVSVGADSSVGWVSAKTASLTDVSGYATYASGANGSDASDSLSFAWSDTSVTFSGNTNLRSGAGLSYGILDTILQGETATYLGSSSTDDRGVVWYSVRFEGVSGWVSSVYASLNNAQNAIVRANGDANVRLGPGLKYSILNTMFEGETAQFSGTTSYDDRGVLWYSVVFEGEAGWISSVYASLDSGSAQTYAFVEASDGDSNVRSGPGLGYSSLCTLYQGERAAYLGTSSVDERGRAWYKISFNGVSGWVSELYTRLTN